MGQKIQTRRNRVQVQRQGREQRKNTQNWNHAQDQKGRIFVRSRSVFVLEKEKNQIMDVKKKEQVPVELS